MVCSINLIMSISASAETLYKLMQNDKSVDGDCFEMLLCLEGHLNRI